MDRCAHQAEEAIQLAGPTPPDPSTHNPPDVCTKVDPASFIATLWFLNGRNGPDTMLKAARRLVAAAALQRARAHAPGRAGIDEAGRGGPRPASVPPSRQQRLADRARWPGARERGRRQCGVSGLPRHGAGTRGPKGATLPDQAISNYTIQTSPGSTYDAIFTWTGKGLNWDIYGHTGAKCASVAATAASRTENEDPASHCKAFPVTLPEQQSVAFGGMWSGSPFLEQLTPLPPLQGGLNPGGGYTFMWHSHTERELTNDDIFPGGMMTMMIIEGPGIPIDSEGNID